MLDLQCVCEKELNVYIVEESAVQNWGVFIQACYVHFSYLKQSQAKCYLQQSHLHTSSEMSNGKDEYRLLICIASKFVNEQKIAQIYTNSKEIGYSSGYNKKLMQQNCKVVIVFQVDNRTKF